MSLRDFRSRVNAELPEHARVSLGTLSNYEREAGGSSRAGPRAEFLAALKRAFPSLRLEWLILGDGEPTSLAERLAAPEGLETKAESSTGGEPSFASRVLMRYPDLELLSPEASALFMAALTRLAMGEPKLALDEEDLLQLAGDLRWLLLLPAGAWGFRHAPPYRTLSDYAVAMLHALSLLMPESGEGDPIADHAASILPRLRRFRKVGF
ncbi:MAG: hypothetical protein F4164_08170 [Gemmatimonadales bacterium]|nr:hypothetical protein [Gemmatimonadales bacterium]MYG49332.1 hypothetical protein [Gemmatimonadales bacterium]MYK03027.1 hypothetical protein [Candidatus Palauibacter ramosifaciens]